MGLSTADEQGGAGNGRFVDLLRTYALTHTKSTAVNGSSPWVGENVEPDKGYWMVSGV
jgi:hypothetical protein